MRKLCFLSAICLFLSLFSGCFLYDKVVGNNISPFVDPLNNENENFIPDSHAEKVITLDVEDTEKPQETNEDEEDEDDGIVVLSENSIRLTKPPIIDVDEDGQLNYYYEGDTFIFQIPFLWRTTMEVDILYDTDGNEEVTYYSYYFVPQNQSTTPVERALVMTLRVSSYYYYLKYGHGKDGYVANGSVNQKDGYVYTYYAPDESQKLPNDFPNIEDYSTIIKVLTNNWNFKHIDSE